MKLEEKVMLAILSERVESNFKEFCKDKGGGINDPTLFREYVFTSLSMIYSEIDKLKNPESPKPLYTPCSDQESSTPEYVSFSSKEEDMC